MVVADDDAHRPPEDRAPAAARARGAQDGPLLRIWHCRPAPSNGHVCAHCALAGLLVVRLLTIC